MSKLHQKLQCLVHLMKPVSVVYNPWNLMISSTCPSVRWSQKGTSGLHNNKKGWWCGRNFEWMCQTHNGCLTRVWRYAKSLFVVEVLIEPQHLVSEIVDGISRVFCLAIHTGKIASLQGGRDVGCLVSRCPALKYFCWLMILGSGFVGALVISVSLFFIGVYLLFPCILIV